MKIFGRRDSAYSGTIIVHNLVKIIANIDMCIDSKLLKDKVIMIFLGTVGFSPPRKEHYFISSLKVTQRFKCIYNEISGGCGDWRFGKDEIWIGDKCQANMLRGIDFKILRVLYFPELVFRLTADRV